MLVHKITFLLRTRMTAIGQLQLMSAAFRLDRN
jgi:hypothetical protein